MGVVIVFIVHGILFERFIVSVFGNDGVINGLGYVLENIKCNLRSDIEELTVLADSQVSKAIYGFVNQLLQRVYRPTARCTT